jgi:hypothetical protein
MHTPANIRPTSAHPTGLWCCPVGPVLQNLEGTQQCNPAVQPSSTNAELYCTTPMPLPGNAHQQAMHTDRQCLLTGRAPQQQAMQATTVREPAASSRQCTLARPHLLGPAPQCNTAHTDAGPRSTQRPTACHTAHTVLLRLPCSWHFPPSKHTHQLSPGLVMILYLLNPRYHCVNTVSTHTTRRAPHGKQPLSNLSCVLNTSCTAARVLAVMGL